MTSTHFEFQSCETNLWLPLQKGKKSPMVTLPWDFVASRHWELLVELCKSASEARLSVVFQQVPSLMRSA